MRSARVYLLEGTLTDEQVAEIKKYVINPVEAREASLDTKATLKMEHPVPTEVEVLDGFNELDEAGLKKFIDEKGLAMDLGDIKFCQEYFRSEKRDPTITEIKMIDTYWSDHCRHTTFGTILDDVQIDDAVVQEAFDRYMAMRADLGRENKPRCMMDLATIGAKELKKQGILKNLDESEEINACTVKIKCDVNSQDDIITLFVREYQKTAPGAKLSELFATQQLKDKVNQKSSDAEVEKVLRAEVKAAVENSYNVLRTRIDRFGVVQPNIQSLEDKMGRIMVELPGIKEPERVRKLLQGSANLEFWETYTAKEILPAMQSADSKLRAILSQETAADSTATNATADTIPAAKLAEATPAKKAVSVADSLAATLKGDAKDEKAGANMEHHER